MIQKIISGGQTGADQGALEAAIELGIPHGGWLPQGRKTEQGPLPKRYHLQELASPVYAERTEANILAADGTLVLSHGPLTNGSALTQRLAESHHKPCLHIDFSLLNDHEAQKQFFLWLEEYNIAVLNVAGPRASKDPRIFRKAQQFLMDSLKKLHETPAT